MSEPIEEFFERLSAGGPGSLPARAKGSLRIDLGSGATHRTLVRHGRRGQRLRLASQREGRRGDQDLQRPVRGHRHREGERDGRRAAWRRVARGRSHPARAVPAGPAGPTCSGEGGDGRERTTIVSDGIVKILDGNTFVVSDPRGDIEASLTDPTGLFSFDTRFLSTWVLTVNGERLNALSVDDLQYFEARFFLVPGTGTVYVDAKLSVIRRRAVGDGFHEELTILNHADGADRAHRTGRCGRRLRRPVRGQGRTQEEGDVHDPDRRGRPAPGVRARDVRPDDDDLGLGAGRRSTRRASRSPSRSNLTVRGRPTWTW